MSVLIRGMEMPKSCEECRFHVDGWCYALLPESEEEQKRITTNYCPLIEIPTPQNGKWKWRSFNIQCSLCEFEPMFDSTEPLYNYCPNCGAEMESE